MDAVTIFLLIGLAHWTTHLFECHTCRISLTSFTKFLGDGAVATLGWPLHLLSYLMNQFGPKSPALTEQEKIELAKQVQARLENIFPKRETPPNVTAVEVSIEQRPGESDDDFEKRIMVALKAEKQKQESTSTMQ